MKKIVLLVVFLLPLVLFAQRRYKQKYNKGNDSQVFPSCEVFAPGGWNFGGGITGTFSLDDPISYSAPLPEPISMEPMNRLGLALEVGRFWNFKRRVFFRYLDYSVNYKGIYAGDRILADIGNGTLSETEIKLNSHHVGLSANLNALINVGRFNFIQNAIGVNADYAFWSDPSTAPMNNRLPSNPIVQVHYRLGFGYVYDTDRVLLVSLETPVYNITPSQSSTSELDLYSFGYRTVTLRLNWYLFRLAPVSCPPVRNPDLPRGFENGYGS